MILLRYLNDTLKVDAKESTKGISDSMEIGIKFEHASVYVLYSRSKEPRQEETLLCLSDSDAPVHAPKVSLAGTATCGPRTR
jgi:hypothetical protein